MPHCPMRPDALPIYGCLHHCGFIHSVHLNVIKTVWPFPIDVKPPRNSVRMIKGVSKKILSGELIGFMISVGYIRFIVAK
jgi:hypothetical protein